MGGVATAGGSARDADAIGSSVIRSRDVRNRNARPGIGFIAPSGQLLDPVALDRAIDYFKARDFRVICPAAVRRSHQRFAGTDAARVQALHAMLARDDVGVVMAVRGGYGLSRLLDQID